MTAGAGFGLYVHWPFCEKKCPYCDFNSHVADRIDQSRWLGAYRTELETFVRDFSGEPIEVTSIFFGGGTPSLMEPETVDGILDAVRQSFPLADDAEITLEANPSSAEAERFKGYAEAGVNRVSIGVQALNDRDLAALGRIHGRVEALETIAAARDIFPRYSFDLIYARPGQSVADWDAELTEALDYVEDHLSVYQLTIEPGTTFARDGVPAADEETAERMYRETQAILENAGLPAYEISNHARPGMESRHNMTYWRGGAYLGIGPGAHSRIFDGKGWRAEYRHYGPVRWLEAVESLGHGTGKTFTLSPQERRDEVTMMGLRLRSGIKEEDFAAATGFTLDQAFSDDRLKHMIEGGFLEKGGGTLRATPEGLLRLDAVLASLLADH